MNVEQFSAAALTAACALMCAQYTLADDMGGADGHAPIGVMGDHTHSKGEFMISYRLMQMDMAGNRSGTDSISPAEIATSVPNRFVGRPMQPPTLRVVPLDMSMTMHMIGAMYAPSDRYTLMAMTSYVSMDMNHVTFAGGMGVNELGNFETSSAALGDTSLSALIRLGNVDSSPWHATLGMSLPTGDVRNTDEVLTPLNTRPTLRLPYPMQIGSGSYDLIGGLTWRQMRDKTSFGAQWRSVVRLADNDEDYRLGDEHQLTGWMSYAPAQAFSLSGRLTLLDRGNLSGIDQEIVAPVQTADPDRQGFTRVDAGLGVNVLLPGGDHGHRLAGELVVPLYQDLDGPQLETDWMLTFGYQRAF